jgi:hypothetical protein
VEEPPSAKKPKKKKTDKSREEKGGVEARKTKSVNKIADALMGPAGLLGKDKGLASIVKRAMTMENIGQPGQEPGKATTNRKSGVAPIDVGNLAFKETSIAEIHSPAKVNRNQNTVSF